jgi:signal transduction histidine kinase
MPQGLLDGAIAEAGTALGQLREVSQELRPIFLERMSLVDAIRFQCSETGERAGVEIRLLAPDVCLGLAERVKEQCFLTFREALGNAVRHAKADRIDVLLEIPSQGRLVLKIMDDGVGFDTRKAHKRPVGLGLSMIQERAASVGGQAEILSVPGRGSCVAIEVPLTEEAAP